MEKILLSDKKAVHQNEEAALLDLGEGIACLQFRSKGNSISPVVKELILETLDKDLYGFDGMVIGSQAKNFSVGANLFTMKHNLDTKNYKAFEFNVSQFQEITKYLKHYDKPIVAAPYKMTLGGGLEVALHCHARVALSKSFMGLVELGVGLIPGGGGTKESAILVGQASKEKKEEVLKTVFEKLLLRKVSTNAEDARKMFYLKDNDGIVEDPEELITAAKIKCRDLVKKDIKKTEEERVTLPGKKSYDWMNAYANELLNQGIITPYDAKVGEKIAQVLAGSAVDGEADYTEMDLLEIERNCFLELVQQKGTYDRITYFVENNELLRN